MNQKIFTSPSMGRHVSSIDFFSTFNNSKPEVSNLSVTSANPNVDQLMTGRRSIFTLYSGIPFACKRKNTCTLFIAIETASAGCEKLLVNTRNKIAEKLNFRMNMIFWWNKEEYLI